VLLSIRKGGLPKASSLQHFEDYRRNEGSGSLASVNQEGTLLEYETLELRVTPPNVQIDTEGDPEATIVTVDSANRPGTLIELVQHFTMLGLNVRSARVSSDGGWFVDEFRLTNNDGSKVTDMLKLDSISRMLNVRACGAGEGEALPVTVVELSGPDRPGLFGALVDVLTTNGCEVRSVSSWTFKRRCAFTVVVTEKGRAVQDAHRQEYLVTQLHEIMAGHGLGNGCAPPTVRWVEVVGSVNHERRLHRLMLQESQQEFARLGPDGDSALASQPSLEAEGAEEEEECVPTDIEPEVTIMEGSSGYWEVLIQCADRPKLLFDATCTLADMDYDIFHATVDILDNVALLEFFIRPREGEPAFDEAVARQLKHALKASIERRFPKGLKIHLQLGDMHGVLGDLLMRLGRAGLNITRARVVEDGRAHNTHALYVMKADGGFPTRKMVEDVCRSIGGSMLPAGSSLASLPRSKASSGVSDTALGNGTSGSPDRGAFAESTVHGASFAFTFCDRGPAHRRRPSGAGGNGHHGGRSRLGLADVDLSRAESTADLQIFDWSRYAHGSNSGDSPPDECARTEEHDPTGSSSSAPDQQGPLQAALARPPSLPHVALSMHARHSSNGSLHNGDGVPSLPLPPLGGFPGLGGLPSPHKGLSGGHLAMSPPVQRPALIVAPQGPIRLAVNAAPSPAANGPRGAASRQPSDRYLRLSRLSNHERVHGLFHALGAVEEAIEPR